MDFPDGHLEPRIELAFGADRDAAPYTWTWTDVTEDLIAQQIAITRGTANEAATAQPASCSLALRNHHGHYTPDNPLSQYWPHVVLGTPFRCSVRVPGLTYLRMDGNPATYASTPDTAALDITGDLDVRAEVTTTWHSPDNQSLISKWSAPDQRSWALRIEGGDLILNWSEDGTTVFFASAPLPGLPERAAVRATLDVNDGTGLVTARFYWAPSLDDTWVQFGEASGTLPGGTSIYASTADLRVAGDDQSATPPRLPFVGKAHRFEVRDGINGTVVAAPNFAQAAGTTSFTDTAGRTWSLAGNAEITDWYVRMTGSVDEWLPTWPYGDLSHGDDPGEARVDITASGILRRLGQGAPVLESTLRRRIPSDPYLLAYWPMEEGRDATAAHSPIAGVQPMRLTGATFEADDSLPGSKALPTMATGGTLSGRVPRGSGGGWHVEMVYKIDGSLPSGMTSVIRVVLTGSVARLVSVSASSSAIRIRVDDEDGTEINHFDFNQGLSDFVGDWARLQIYALADGSDVEVYARWIKIGTDATWFAFTTYTGTVGDVSAVEIPALDEAWDGIALGHIAAFDTTDTLIYNHADHGFTGELAAARILRLCEEEGVPIALHGAPDETAAMGPQGTATLLELLSECADADGGILGEQREALGLRYRTRASLYNQAPAIVLDAAQNQIANPFAPALDDQRIRNDISVQREGGSTARVQDPASISTSGRYDEQLTVNVKGDDQLPDIAGWRLHLGTWPGMRYPALTWELALAPTLIPAWLRAESGDRLQVVNLPPQHPTDAVDVLMQGYTETLSPTRWTVTAPCLPGGPWHVGHVEDEVYGWADTDGSELAAPAGPSDTTLYVRAYEGPQWTTDPSDLPVDLRVGGEIVTVTAIGAAVDGVQEMTVTRSVNGVRKPHAAGTDVRLAYPAIVAL